MYAYSAMKMLGHRRELSDTELQQVYVKICGMTHRDRTDRRTHAICLKAYVEARNDLEFGPPWE